MRPEKQCTTTCCVSRAPFVTRRGFQAGRPSRRHQTYFPVSTRLPASLVWRRCLVVTSTRPRSSIAGCSTRAIRRVAMKRPVRTGCPVRVTSRTSTTPRDVTTSMRRPARVATISKACTPCPVSTNASTRSPFMEPTILPGYPFLRGRSTRSSVVGGKMAERAGLLATPNSPFRGMARTAPAEFGWDRWRLDGNYRATFCSAGRTTLRGRARPKKPPASLVPFTTPPAPGNAGMSGGGWRLAAHADCPRTATGRARTTSLRREPPLHQPPDQLRRVSQRHGARRNSPVQAGMARIEPESAQVVRSVSEAPQLGLRLPT